MATKKVGALVKEARAGAGLTQEQLARKVTGASAADISELERGKVDFTQAQLKQIAKACGVTQSSLINAPKNVSATAKKTTASKSTGTTAKKSTSTSGTAKKSTSSKSASSSTAKKTASTSSKSASSSTAKKTTSTAKKSTSSSASKSASSGTSMKVSATEKKLVELYREANSDTKKVVMGILKGEPPEPPAGFGFGDPLPSSPVDEIIGSIINGALDVLGRR